MSRLRTIDAHIERITSSTRFTPEQKGCYTKQCEAKAYDLDTEDEPFGFMYSRCEQLRSASRSICLALAVSLCLSRSACFTLSTPLYLSRAACLALAVPLYLSRAACLDMPVSLYLYGCACLALPVSLCLFRSVCLFFF